MGKDTCQWPVMRLSFVSKVSLRPAYQAIRAQASSKSSQLIGRAATTMNHADIRGSEAA